MKTDNAFLAVFMRYKIYRMNFSLTVIACLLLIAYSLAMGVAMLVVGKGLFVYTASINDDCAGGSCRFAIRVRKAVPLPVVVYVGFENFHLNHRKAMLSISMDQLSPEDDVVDDLGDCAGYATNADAARFYPQLFGGLAPEDEIKPCGLRPLLYRNCSLTRQRRHHPRAQLRGAAARRREERLPAQGAERALRLQGPGLLDRLPRPFS